MTTLRWAGQDQNSVENDSSREKPTVVSQIVGEDDRQDCMEGRKLNDTFLNSEGDDLHCAIA